MFLCNKKMVFNKYNLLKKMIHDNYMNLKTHIQREENFFFNFIINPNMNQFKILS